MHSVPPALGGSRVGGEEPRHNTETASCATSWGGMGLRMQMMARAANPYSLHNERRMQTPKTKTMCMLLTEGHTPVCPKSMHTRICALSMQACNDLRTTVSKRVFGQQRNAHRIARRLSTSPPRTFLSTHSMWGRQATMHACSIHGGSDNRGSHTCTTHAPPLSFHHLGHKDLVLLLSGLLLLHDPGRMQCNATHCHASPCTTTPCPSNES